MKDRPNRCSPASSHAPSPEASWSPSSTSASCHERLWKPPPDTRGRHRPGKAILAGKPIDVWDAKTFDPALSALLAGNTALVRDYMERDRQIFLDHDLGRSRAILRPENAHARAYLRLADALGREMEGRAIRAWHYTRLTNHEVDLLRRDGIRLSTLSGLQTRLDAQVETGAITAASAAALFATSPFHQQRESRSNKFWMTSHPIAIDDGGVEPLMAHWGGEGASMWMKDPMLLGQVAALGAPRILEVHVPVAATNHAYLAGEAMLATFGRELGYIPEKRAFDLYTKRALPPGALLAVHTEGDATFAAMGQGHPAGFVDVSIGRWKALTGEDG
jgi:hypothetical protein